MHLVVCILTVSSHEGCQCKSLVKIEDHQLYRAILRMLPQSFKVRADRSMCLGTNTTLLKETSIPWLTGDHVNRKCHEYQLLGSLTVVAYHPRLSQSFCQVMQSQGSSVIVVTCLEML